MDGQRALPHVEYDAATDGRRAAEIARFRRGTAKLGVIFLGVYFTASAVVHASPTYAILSFITLVFGAWIWTRRADQ